jgi:hypothetical protein
MEQQKNTGQTTEQGQEQSGQSQVTANPNPRANENLENPSTDADNQDTSGVGSEITDGEDG